MLRDTDDDNEKYIEGNAKAKVGDKKVYKT